MQSFRLPDFLVIGAMKAGTTTLCDDLSLHPGIFFPTVKEPHTLVMDEVLTIEGKSRYAQLFQRARADQKCGEGSTGYTKIPLHKGVPERAKKLIGSELKLVYIVRNPIDRAISHHYHMYRGGDAPFDFGEALETNPLILECSSYAKQILPWIEEFGRENIKVVKFEDYKLERNQTVEEIFAFLGVEYRDEEIEEEKVLNAGEDQLLPPDVARNMIRSVTRSQWYKRKIHPNTPAWVRDLFKKTFYRKAESRPPPPASYQLDMLVEYFARDMSKLSTLFEQPALHWDLEATKMRYSDAGMHSKPVQD